MNATFCARWITWLTLILPIPLGELAASDVVGDDPPLRVLVLGNSHGAGMAPVLEALLKTFRPESQPVVVVAPGARYLSERLGDGETEELLTGRRWTYVILQAQKYSTTGRYSYSTDAAEYWIQLAKEQGAIPILFPEHPRAGHQAEGRRTMALHEDIAGRTSSCVAPVIPVWERVADEDVPVRLYASDGNHASRQGLLLNAMIFFQLTSGLPAISLPDVEGAGIPAGVQRIFREAVANTPVGPACDGG